MDREQVFAGLARRLRTAFSASKWRELERVDAEMALLLRKLPVGKALTRAERVAFADLEAAHAEARAHCEHEAGIYAARMSSMRENRIAWMAYAMVNESGMEQT